MWISTQPRVRLGVILLFCPLFAASLAPLYRQAKAWYYENTEAGRRAVEFREMAKQWDIFLRGIERSVRQDVAFRHGLRFEPDSPEQFALHAKTIDTWMSQAPQDVARAQAEVGEEVMFWARKHGVPNQWIPPEYQKRPRDLSSTEVQGLLTSPLHFRTWTSDGALHSDRTTYSVGSYGVSEFGSVRIAIDGRPWKGGWSRGSVRLTSTESPGGHSGASGVGNSRFTERTTATGSECTFGGLSFSIEHGKLRLCGQEFEVTKEPKLVVVQDGNIKSVVSIPSLDLTVR